jgi:hypothetical protein
MSCQIGEQYHCETSGSQGGKYVTMIFTKCYIKSVEREKLQHRSLHTLFDFKMEVKRLQLMIYLVIMLSVRIYINNGAL